MSQSDNIHSRPFLTPEAQESKLVSLAYSLAEKRLMDGTATSQEVTHFLKLGSKKESLERIKLENENILLQAKTKKIESEQRTEEMYANAIKAMRKYTGNVSDEDEEDEY